MDELKSYVLSSMLWDPLQDPEDVISEFLAGYYSAQAAPHVRDFLSTMSSAAACARPQTSPSTNSAWNWRSDGPAYLTFESLLRSHAAFGAALAAAPLPLHRQRLRKASMAVLLPALWRWDALREFSANHSIRWPLASTRAEAFQTFAEIYNESGTQGLVNVNFSPCGVHGWQTDCVFECALGWLHECIFTSSPAGCSPTGHPREREAPVAQPWKTDDEPLRQRRQATPYSLLWNSPWPSTCARKNAAVDWVAMRITTNANTTDNGAAVSTFQPEHTGLVPKFVTGPGCAPHKPCVAWRGGIPQKVNMTRHVAKWRADIEKYLPDPTATGVAALDWEDWKPSFESNRGGTYKEYEIYINASVADVRARHPGWSYERQYEQAKVEFEAAAKALFTTTIDVAKTMRPHMSWGFYGFPATCGCDHDGQIRDRCSTPNANDELMWLWSHVSGLFPSIYIPTANATANRLFVDCIMRESQRVSREAGGLPVWVYAQYLSEATHQQLSPSDTVSEYARAQAWGAAGAIMWGSTAGARTLCNSTAGLTPWLSQNAHVFASVVARAERCGDERCHSRGRCVELPTPRCQCFTGSIQSNCSDVSIG